MTGNPRSDVARVANQEAAWDVHTALVLVANAIRQPASSPDAPAVPLS